MSLEAWELEDAAREFAFRWHGDQTDQAGRPYTQHLARVVDRFHVSDLDARAVAWLHDVIEDTDATADDLHAAGFPDRIVVAVVALTHPHGEPRTVYYERVRGVPLACRVKVADVDDNTDPDRLALLDEPTRARLERKYAQAREALGVLA